MKEPIHIDLAALAGVDQETFSAADSGDRQAQKVVLRNLLTADASAEALTTKHWTHWMLRAIATGAPQAISDVLGSIDEAGRNGVIGKVQLNALHALFEQHFGPGEVGRPTADTVRGAFAGAPRDLRVIELFLIADRLASGAAVELHELEQAQQEAAALDAAGTVAFFKAVWAQLSFRTDPMAAFTTGLDAVKQLSEVASGDAVYQAKVGQVATLLSQMANALGDAQASMFIMAVYAGEIAVYQASEQ